MTVADLDRLGAPPCTPADAHLDMLLRHGRRGRGTCEGCAWLRATARARPDDRMHRPLTTFSCARDDSGAPWSVLAPACGAFDEA